MAVKATVVSRLQASSVSPETRPYITQGPNVVLPTKSHPIAKKCVSTWGGTRREGWRLTCVICRGNNKSLPDAQASPLSATSLSLTAAVLGAIQPSLSFSIRSILEPSQPAKPFKRIHTYDNDSFFKTRKKSKSKGISTRGLSVHPFSSLSLSLSLTHSHTHSHTQPL